MNSHNWIRALLVVAIGPSGAFLVHADEPGSIEYTLTQPGQVSAAVYDAEERLVRTLLSGAAQNKGTHRLTWDGLDRNGQPMPIGNYVWKVLRTPRFRAEYVTSLGINPGSERYDRWVGNHGGAASVAVDPSGMYLAAQVTETAPVLLKQSLDGTSRHWTRSRGDVTLGRYQGGASLACDGRGRLFMLQQNGYLQVIDAREGTLLATWDVLPKDLKRKEDGGPTWFIYQHGDRVAGADMDARAGTIVVSYRDHHRVRWLDPKDGATVAEIDVPEPTGVAVGAKGNVFVISGNRVLRVFPDGRQIPVIENGLTSPRRLAIDPETGEFLVAERSPGSQIKRFSLDGKIIATYGRPGGRLQGAYHGEDFRGITDIAPDGKGGFVVAELEPAPRRIVHCNRDGEVLNEWFGGQPYYAWGEPDPRDPSRVWFNSGHWLVLAEIDYASGDWQVLESWHLDQMADGLVESRPGHHGRWWVVYHEDQRYLVSQGAPQVLAHKSGSLRPVSVIGSRNVKRAVELARKGTDASSFRWLDRNGDGRPQPAEFTFSESSEIPNANWVAPDFAVLQAGSGDREEQPESRCRLGLCPDTCAHRTGSGRSPNLRSSSTSEDSTTGFAFVVLETRPNWENGLPVYPIGDEPGVKQRVVGTIVEARIGTRGSGAYRDLAGNYYGNFNDGCERHGAGWPTDWGGVSRLVKWDASGSERWSVGRHAIHGGLGNEPGSTPPGQLHVPVNVIGEVNDTVILADRVETPAMAWTQDGLYAGSFFDHRTDDGLPKSVYRWWRAPDGTKGITASDNGEGGRVIQRKDGAVFWFAQGRNSIPVYQIYGWDDWTRLEGVVSLTEQPRHAAREGTGLRVELFANPKIGGSPAIDRVDSQIWYGSPRHSPDNDSVIDGFHHGPAYDCSKGVDGLEATDGFAARWTGQIETPLSESFTFSTYARGGVRLWIDDRQRIFGWNETVARWETEPIPLKEGRRYAVQLDFYTTQDHPACSLNWESPSLDRRRIPSEFLYPEPVPKLATEPDARPATERIDAITFDEQSGDIGPKDVRGSIGGLRQRALGKSGAWVGYRRIDFGTGVSRVHLEATGNPAGRGDYPVTLTIRLDAPDGPSVANVTLTSDGPVETTTALANELSGTHDVYVVNTTEKGWHFVQLYGFKFE